jgi:serine/threonine-protein kinase HipA
MVIRYFSQSRTAAKPTGNGDAHAKNFAALTDIDGEWRVSPAYDVPSSYPYGDKTMAMAIGNRRGPDLAATDFVGLGARLGVPERSVRRALQDLAERSNTWLDDLTRLPFDSGQVRKLRRVITRRRELISR